MVDLAFFDIKERTGFSDELYAIVGRAFTVAVHYENNCKLVANYLGIHETVDGLENFKVLFEKLDKNQLKRNIDKFTSTVRTNLVEGGMAFSTVETLDTFIVNVLDEGRKARNFISHELAVSLSEQAENEELKQRIIEITRQTVNKVAIADFWMASFIAIYINKNSVSPSLEKYVKTIVRWVCDTEN